MCQNHHVKLSSRYRGPDWLCASRYHHVTECLLLVSGVGCHPWGRYRREYRSTREALEEKLARARATTPPLRQCQLLTGDHPRGRGKTATVHSADKRAPPSSCKIRHRIPHRRSQTQPRLDRQSTIRFHQTPHVRPFIDRISHGHRHPRCAEYADELSVLSARMCREPIYECLDSERFDAATRQNNPDPLSQIE